MVVVETIKESRNISSEKLTRLDIKGELKDKILPLCRLQKGEIWEDPVNGHRV